MKLWLISVFEDPDDRGEEKKFLVEAPDERSALEAAARKMRLPTTTGELDALSRRITLRPGEAEEI